MMHEIRKYKYSGRVDTEDLNERIHQQIQDFNGQTKAPVIIGFSSEEGIKRNKGRLGAKEAPFKVREKLSSYAYNDTLYDAGTIIGDEDLEASQKSLAEKLAEIYEVSSRPIIIGGGHETLYGHYLGIRQIFDGKLAILNFDAHFDLRDERPSSGTMFHQILTADNDVDYYVLGLQKQGNTKTLYDTADRFNVNYYSIDDVRETAAADTVFKQLRDYDTVIMTLCMDSVEAATAPGVSAMTPNGYTAIEIHNLIAKFSKLDNLKSFDISEVSPPLDENDRTSALAASIIYKFLSVNPFN
ncbi:formimidoylglutamase [Jeotgalicoccus sp. S0W5]|uniref:formimidoylglutamase n=1 Tax=Jeotgalicoccus sp. S0W5 TaxID=2527874 RepID=UPI001F118679|nr:formimidoylglutamase [Jeotgalicoccus sp. S0W5]